MLGIQSSPFALMYPELRLFVFHMMFVPFLFFRKQSPALAVASVTLTDVNTQQVASFLHRYAHSSYDIYEKKFTSFPTVSPRLHHPGQWNICSWTVAQDKQERHEYLIIHITIYLTRKTNNSGFATRSAVIVMTGI